MRLRHINTLLVVAILAVNLYIVIAPFLPIIMAKTPIAPGQAQRLQERIERGETPKTSQNMLVIPSIGLEQNINEGSDLRAAAGGPWRLPHTSTPDKGSNTVIVGHRFTYKQPRGTFYHLDKLRPGQPLGLHWQGKFYRYTVSNVQTVPADRKTIEDPSREPKLTLYTCTPLWWPTDRLVITADLKGVTP